MHVNPVDQANTVEDSYELAPMQQGMLYHTLEAPHSGVYCILVSYRLHGALDVSAFIRAWQEVVSRHPVLRTSFDWQTRGEPVQRVHARAVLEVRQDDWRGLSESELEARLTRLLEAESRAGFDLATPPLMRLSLIRSAENIHDLVVAHHHLLMDGSCKHLLFSEVFAFYEAFRQGQGLELESAHPYRAFIDWLREQDLAEAERFWRQELAGFIAPTPLWPAARPAGVPEREYDEHHSELAAAESEGLRLFGRRHRLTLNTLVTGMWAVLLSRSGGNHDVVFGATVNGRPSSLVGAESILGLFINTLPVRITVSPSTPVVAWLQAIQAHQAAARDYDFAPLRRIQRSSDVPRGRALFESILVFENNIGYGSGPERYGGIGIMAVRPFIRNSLPLTLRCVPGPTLSFQLLYDARRFSAAAIRSIAEQLLELLRDMPLRGDAPLSGLLGHLDEMDARRCSAEAMAFERTAAARLSTLKRDGRRMRDRQL